MRITDLMCRHVVTVGPDEPLRTAAEAILWTEHRHLPVVSKRDIVGVISERDFLRHADDLTRPVREVMSRPAITISSEESLDTAARRIALHRIGCLPVLHQGDLIGIVTASDLLRGYLRAERDRPRPAELTAGIVMTHPAVTASPDEYLVNAIAKMQMAGIRHLPVVDGEGTLIGILSDRDIRLEAGSLEGSFPRLKDDALQVRSVMTEDVASIRANAGAGDLMTAFSSFRLGALPVVDESNRLIGIVSYVDVLAEAAKRMDRSAPATR
jgi:CBS-domain-containing membrane protein